MSKIDIPQMKSILSAVKKRRHERAMLLRAVARSQQMTGPRPTRNKRSQTHRDFHHTFQGHMLDAAEDFFSVEGDFRQGIEDRRKAIEQLAAINSPFVPTYVMVDTPFLIWPQHTGYDAGQARHELIDSHIESGNNWAKYLSEVGEGDGGDIYSNDQLSFYFIWENSTGADAVINLTSFLMLKGNCYAGAFPGWWWNPFWSDAGTGYMKSSATVELSIWEWWHQPPTEPLRQPDQIQSVKAFELTGGWYWLLSDGATQSAIISDNYHVHYDMFRVPNHEIAVFEVTLNINYEGWDAQGMFNFDLILCPYLQLEIVSPPPPAIG